MICTSIQGKSFSEIQAILSMPEIEMAEIRLDLCPLSHEQIHCLFSESAKPLVATCRIADKQEISRRQLFAAIEAGADYADLEIEAPEEYSKEFTTLCKRCGTKIIRSYHNFDKTPDLENLKAIATEQFASGAHIVKIATTTTEQLPSSRISRNQAKANDGLNINCEKSELQTSELQILHTLYKLFPKGRILAFAMGEAGKTSRIYCLKYGAPFTYASLTEADATAPGQFTTSEMRTILYKDIHTQFHENLHIENLNTENFHTTPNSAEAASEHFNRVYDSIPSSKSYAQRAIVAAALASGVSRMEISSPCRDIESAISVAESLGAKISVESLGKKIILSIEGIVSTDANTHIEELNVGESGLLTRLMIPVISAINSCNCTLTGARTLVGRPLKGAMETMQEFGVTLKSDGNIATIPMALTGTLHSASRTISGEHGSQIISGLLMALPLCKGDSVIEVLNPKSIPYLHITTGILKQFGISVEEKSIEGPLGNIEKIIYKIKGGQSYNPVDMSIEKDWSGAANMLVAGALYGSATLMGMNTHTLQGDAKILEILQKAGAKVIVSPESEGETVTVSRAPLYGFEANLDDTPDLFPIVALLAAFCTGTSRLKGVYRLVGKESNRAKAIIEMLTQMGVEARISNETMEIDGQSLESRILNDTLPRGGSYTSSHDHRMAMALKVASLCSAKPIEIDDFDCVAKSFPNFAL